jgi:hypothetical protein
MQEQPPVRSGLYLMRVWIEDGSVRARITETLDLTGREQTTLAVAGNDEIEARLHSWLQAFTAPVTRQ